MVVDRYLEPCKICDIKPFFMFGDFVKFETKFRKFETKLETLIWKLGTNCETGSGTKPNLDFPDFVKFEILKR